MKHKSNLSKISVISAIFLICIAVGIICAPACAYCYDQALLDHSQDWVEDQFYLKYDPARLSDKNFSVTFYNTQASPDYAIGKFKYKSYTCDILKDNRTDEPGLILLKVPDDVELSVIINDLGQNTEKDGILYTKLDLIPFDVNDPRYAPAIFDAYRKDRLYVSYKNKKNSDERLPWDIIYQIDDDDYVLKIPDGMSLSDAVKYCNSLDYIFSTDPSGFLYFGDASDIKEQYLDIYIDVLGIIYLPNSTYYRHPWQIKSKSILLGNCELVYYYLPENMTIADAIAFSGNFDNIIGFEFGGPIYFSSSYIQPGQKKLNQNYFPPTHTSTLKQIDSQEQNQTIENTTQNTAQSPIGMMSILAGLIGIIAVVLRKN